MSNRWRYRYFHVYSLHVVLGVDVYSYGMYIILTTADQSCWLTWSEWTITDWPDKGRGDEEVVWVCDESPQGPGSLLGAAWLYWLQVLGFNQGLIGRTLFWLWQILPLCGPTRDTKSVPGNEPAGRTCITLMGNKIELRLLTLLLPHKSILL